MTRPTLNPDELVLGVRFNENVPRDDQVRQRREVDEILRRLKRQPGVILADEVGMGKTFVALGVTVQTALRDQFGPVIVMVPPMLVEKWKQDLNKFCEYYMPSRRPVEIGCTEAADAAMSAQLRHAEARDGTTLLRLLGHPPRARAHVIFLTHGAMSRQRMDPWISLFLIAQALGRHARGRNARLIAVKGVIHRSLAELLGMRGKQSMHELDDALWQRLLRSPAKMWPSIYNPGVRNEADQLRDEPVPKAVHQAVGRVDLRTLADTLKDMPLRARGGEQRVSDRIAIVRDALRNVNRQLWAEVLAESRWHSPLLVMDEAHHLKNTDNLLSRQLQDATSESDLQTGEGAMARRFDRMLFLTATPFQLGHSELVRVLERFGGVSWRREAPGERSLFLESIRTLEGSLDRSQRTSIELQKHWSRMLPEDMPAFRDDLERWWEDLQAADPGTLSIRKRDLLSAFEAARRARAEANERLRLLVIRHNKHAVWTASGTPRRERHEGRSMVDPGARHGTGIIVPDEQLLPFFLAARAAVNPHKDLLGEALCSSYEALQKTREHRQHQADFDQESETRVRDSAPPPEVDSLLRDRWYAEQLKSSLDKSSEAAHPKIAATVQRAADLWEAGEKVVVFAFYRHTCSALSQHIGQEIRRRTTAKARERLGRPPGKVGSAAVDAAIERIQERYFDATRARGKRALDAELHQIVKGFADRIDARDDLKGLRAELVTVMRRFLRVRSTLARCFPLELAHGTDHACVVKEFLDHVDSSGMSWRHKFHAFIEFLLTQCSKEECARYRSELPRISTAAHTAVCSGAIDRQTRERRMRTFNTPFLPDILVCSEVMAEGVDLHRFCRYMIHHDLAWNPSTIEQRTGRIDRIGCKATDRHAITSYLPYISGGADERQFRVMRDREQWFQVVMGQDAVANLINAETAETMMPLPRRLADDLAFDLSLG